MWYMFRGQVREFRKNMREQTEVLKEKELKYSEIMKSEPKTVSELNDKISKMDEYKIFMIQQNENFISNMKFYREINSKYKKSKSIDEQIDRVEQINNNVLNSYTILLIYIRNI